MWKFGNIDTAFNNNSEREGEGGKDKLKNKRDPHRMNATVYLREVEIFQNITTKVSSNVTLRLDVWFSLISWIAHWSIKNTQVAEHLQRAALFHSDKTIDSL